MRWFFDHSTVSRIESKDFDFFYGQLLAAFSIFGECAKIFQPLMRTLLDQYFDHGRRNNIAEPQENKMQLKFIAFPTGKISLCVFSVCAK